MKLEDQVCSKELAIKLHELHVTKPSLFYWEWTGATEIERWENDKPDFCEDNICAYTVAELGEMLKDNKLDLAMPRYWNDAWEFEDNNEKFIRSQTEADARALLLIYLIENKLITPPTL